MAFIKLIKAENVQQEDQLLAEADNKINELEEALETAIDCANRIETIFDDLGIHSADIQGYLVNYLDDFINGSFSSQPSVEEFRSRLQEYRDAKLEHYYVFMNGQKISPAFDSYEDAHNWAETNYSIDDDRITIEKDEE